MTMLKNAERWMPGLVDVQYICFYMNVIEQPASPHPGKLKRACLASEELKWHL